MGNRWYAEEAGFFGPSYIEEFAHVYDPVRIRAEADFIDDALGRDRSKTVLDLACGNGRHTIELARRGYNMIGLDLNGFFLTQAAMAATEAGVTARWIRSDMREIPFEGEIDAVLFLFSSFGYLESDRDHQRVLDSIGTALKPGGVFVMDYINREWIMRNYRSNDWRTLPSGTLLLLQRQFDLIAGTNREQRVRITLDGNRREVSMVVRMYTMTELVKMFETAKLRLVGVSGGYNDEPLTIDSRFVVIRACREGS